MSQSTLLLKVPGIFHAFGNASEPIPFPEKAHWELVRPQWKQVHGASCGEITRPLEEAGEVDALWTTQLALPTAVVTADCVPILLARKDGGAVAAVHAGWRGTQARILESLWRQLRKRGQSPSDWVAAIGPAIGPCCYEVSEELARDFQQSCQDLLAPAQVLPHHRHLDLPAINAAQLHKLGFHPAQVDLLRACTLCSRDQNGAPLYHSYRRAPGAGRQYSYIVRRAHP